MAAHSCFCLQSNRSQNNEDFPPDGISKFQSDLQALIDGGTPGDSLPFLNPDESAQIIHAKYLVLHVPSGSGMPYELSIYQPKLVGYFEKWSQEFKEDSLRQDAYSRASRVYALLKNIIPTVDDTIVPADSVIREFIGGLNLSS